MKSGETQWMNPKKLSLLEGNPRKITKADFDRLVDSIRINGFWPHRPMAVTEKDGRLMVLGGNQRLKAARKLGLEKVPVVVYSELEPDEENDIIIRDNINNGDWDFDALRMDDAFSDYDFGFAGLTIPDLGGNERRQEEGGEGDDDEEEDTSSVDEKPFRDKLKDVLYDSDNDFEIPNLLPEMQADKLELPFVPWGAASRLRKDVATYHFYVDDYRFEALWKDPIKLLTSGCKAIVEPNCSCHDQTPIAWGIQLIYKKRWLSRYLQECGIKVFADLNVAHKFIEYNRMGLPQGYNAFFTRGLDGWMESLKSDLLVAQEISGLEKPNLIVYGGGKEIKRFCQSHGLLYVSDFINAKKI